ncbi:MAG: UDP-glucose/GDP-mannose dehydrogenase family protein, partial [Muribaculaceae bacterium]|nr:UDP-glucose/GDP-mannose dehydrogenase family protein [Muribaculaceae bacterium]
MKIAIVGTGYVGLVSGACFAEVGIDVTCIDIDKAKINRLKNGDIPIYEPGLDDLVSRNINEGRLHFSTDLASCIDDVEVVFNAVGTPPDEDGSADLKYVLEVARTFGRHINKYSILVTKSTVPVGTSQKVKSAIDEELAKRGVNIPYEVASNPEFLKEGAAIKDFMSPDRVVIGVESDCARRVMERLYRPFLLNNFRVIFMDIASAEMTKYAANSMLATRISFMNDIANLCELVGADINLVRKGIGADARIGNKFLYAGCGYGGSCFPKDVKALIHTGHEHGYTMSIIEAVEHVNQKQKSIVYHKLRNSLGNLTGKRIAMWGLSFKPETDDMREAPSLVVIEHLLADGAEIVAFDPVAMDEARRRFGDSITYARDMYDAVIDADAIAMMT